MDSADRSGPMTDEQVEAFFNYLVQSGRSLTTAGRYSSGVQALLKAGADLTEARPPELDRFAESTRVVYSAAWGALRDFRGVGGVQDADAPPGALSALPMEVRAAIAWGVNQVLDDVGLTLSDSKRMKLVRLHEWVVRQILEDFTGANVRKLATLGAERLNAFSVLSTYITIWPDLCRAHHEAEALSELPDLEEEGRAFEINLAVARLAHETFAVLGDDARRLRWYGVHFQPAGLVSHYVDCEPRVEVLAVSAWELAKRHKDPVPRHLFSYDPRHTNYLDRFPLFVTPDGFQMSKAEFDAHVAKAEEMAARGEFYAAPVPKEVEAFMSKVPTRGPSGKWVPPGHPNRPAFDLGEMSAIDADEDGDADGE